MLITLSPCEEWGFKIKRLEIPIVVENAESPILIIDHVTLLGHWFKSSLVSILLLASKRELALGDF